MLEIAAVWRAMEEERAGTLSLRLSALATHFIGTVAIGAMAYGLIRLVWFPNFFWKIAGGSELFFLICGVDAVLGPLLTFSVFNPAKGKHRLRRDLLIIVTLQLTALGYGLWTTAMARPLFLAYSVDRFNLVSAMDLSDGDLAAAERKEFGRRSWMQPQVIGTREAKNSDEKLKFIDSAIAGKDRHLLPQTYVPFPEVRSLLLARAQPLSALPASEVSRAKDLAAQWSKSHPNLVFVPVIAKGDWIMLVDSVTGELLDTAPLSAF